MGFLDRAIMRGISKGVGDAIGKAVEQAVTPKATELADKTAQQLDRAAAGTAQQTTQAASDLNGAFANLQRAAEGFGAEMSKNMKLCPACGQPAGADKKFCPSCGAKLPEETVAQGAVCPSCGKQNSIGTKFCYDCGTKLPAAVQAEQAAQAKDTQALAQWDESLSAYPKWTCGGAEYRIELFEGDQYTFSATFPSSLAAQEAVKQYRVLLQENGFGAAGQYPSVEHLYKRIGGVCYHVDTEHCFDCGEAEPMIAFDTEEP